jgi:hypothetical protein
MYQCFEVYHLIDLFDYGIQFWIIYKTDKDNGQQNSLKPKTECKPKLSPNIRPREKKTRYKLPFTLITISMFSKKFN